MADDSENPEATKTGAGSGSLQALSGWIAGLAGVVAAVTLLATNSEKLIDVFWSPKPPAGAASGPSDPPLANPAAFSGGETTIRGTWQFDLDNGVTVTIDSDADLFWEQETDIKRSLRPMNKALFALVGPRDFDSLSLQTLKGLDYQPSEIRADNDVSNAIPSGTIVAYKTRHGRYGKLLVENYAYDLKVKWLTFGP